jgi:hypothetical protein
MCYDSISHQFGYTSFCKHCYSLIFRPVVNHVIVIVCPGCGVNESWEVLGHPCISCMLAAIIYCNPFHKRFQGYLDQWLNSSDSDDSDHGMSIPRRRRAGTSRTIAHTSHTSEEQLLHHSYCTSEIDVLNALSGR